MNGEYLRGKKCIITSTEGYRLVGKPYIECTIDRVGKYFVEIRIKEKHGKVRVRKIRIDGIQNINVLDTKV